MRTTDHFNEFPEKFPFDSLDSIGLTQIGKHLAKTCKEDMESKDRVLVPGLRYAMREIIAWD